LCRFHYSFYSYLCDCEEAASFPEAQFVSEFGFQSMPSFQAYRPVTDKAQGDWNADSELLLYRQRHQDGNSQIMQQISKHFTIPEANADCADKQFDDYLFLTGE
jgi:beta-mannosidase